MKNYAFSNRPRRVLTFISLTTFLLTLTFLFVGCGRPETSGLSSDSEPNNKNRPCVVVSTTDLYSITKAIAGDYLELHCFGKGHQDPHVLNILPSHVKQMNEADLWIQVGSDIEAGWYPDLISKVKNQQIIIGELGFLDLSTNAFSLEGYVGGNFFTRQKSGFHEKGNPHYLLDPIEGIKAGSSILQRLSIILPSKKDEMAINYAGFRQQLAAALIGEELAQRHDVIEIANHYTNGSLNLFLEKQNHGIPLGGWLGSLRGYKGRVIVGDHDLWPYFVRRIGLSIVGYFEPKPGLPPTMKHLKLLIEDMAKNNANLIFSAPYFDERHADFISARTSAKILPMCHQTGARPYTQSYFDTIRHNMENVIKALAE